MTLHPPQPIDRRPCPILTADVPLHVSTAEVKRAILSFPNGSAGGPDSLRPQHLKDLLAVGDSTDPLLEAITDFINLILDGRTPEEVRPILFGGSLTALNKKGGGVRPIAVGYVWRRLAGKVACGSVREAAVTLLAPRQLGFGVSRGCEGAVHAARRYADNLLPDQVMLKLDFKNAFNTIRRDAMLEAVALHFPKLYRFVESAYGSPSTLRFGDFSVPSCEGAQQGDPLGPLMFCLGIHALLSSMKSELVLGYLDDITLCGDTDTVIDDFLKFESGAAALGLSLNRSKCELSGLTSETRNKFLYKNIQIQEVDLDKLELLGSPLLSGPVVDHVLEMKRLDLVQVSKRLPLMPAHDSLFLLTNILSMPRLLYTLRTTCCVNSSELVRYDETLRSTLGLLVNVELSQTAWEQASLPINFGGLGIRSAVLLAPSAFLASAAGANDIITSLLPTRLHSTIYKSYDLALTAWKNQTLPSCLEPDIFQSKYQKAWDNLCCQLLSSNLFDAAQDAPSKARLLASSTETSGMWLKAIPLTTIGLKLDDEAVRIAVGLRLGTNICEPHICHCGVRVDARGTHGLACRSSAGRHTRHNQLNDVIWRALQRAQIPSAKEPTGLCRADGKRPDGVTMIPWARGRCLTWDVTVPDTLAPSHVNESAARVGSAAAKSEVAKTTKYSSILTTHSFVPLVFETLGSWGHQCIAFVNDLGRRLTQVTGEKLEGFYLRQRLSIAIQRGNSIACRGTLHSESEEQ
jgi:hypothetical protein